MDTVGGRRFRGGRGVLLSQCQLTFQNGDLFLGVCNALLCLVQLPLTLGQLPLTIRQFAAQPLVLLSQSLALIALRPFLAEHASDGTPISLICTAPEQLP
jgi:hypothetical protein